MFIPRLLARLIVPAGVAAFIAAMCAGPGVIIVPASLRLADWFLCPNGGTAVPYVLHNPYSPGEAVWNGDTSCIGAEGERIPGRDNLAFPAMCVTYLVPLAVLFSLGWIRWTRNVQRTWGDAGRPVTPASRLPTRVDPQTRQEAQELLALGQRIEAIKLVRERTAMGLKEAKDYVDALAETPPDAEEVETLRQLKQMMDEGLITIQEYQAKKSDILSRM